MLTVGEAIPLTVLGFIAAQLGMGAEDLDGYAIWEETRREHLAELRRIYGYRIFSGRCARDLKVWLEHEAEGAHSNEGLARRFVEECRRRQVILPDYRSWSVFARARWLPQSAGGKTRIAAGLDDAMRMGLDRLLTEEVDGDVSRFVWLRRFEVGRNSADSNGLQGRLEFLQGFDLPSDLLETVPPHRVARLRRQGERYFTDGLRDISGDRRLAILAVCAVEWRGAVAGAVVETHDRIVGQTFRSAKRRCDALLQDSRAVLHDTLDAFRTLGAALLEAKGDGAPLEEAVAAAGGWQKLEGVVAAAEQLNDTMSADPLAHVVQGWPRFRRYAPRMLPALDIQTSCAGEPILAALRAIGAGSNDMPRTFLRRNSRWQQHLNARPTGDRRLWEVAALFHMRDAFRSGDIWLARSRRYGDVKRALVPIEAAHATARLAVPFEPREWLAEHQAHLVKGLDRLADAARHGRIPGGAIENGELRISRPATAMPEDFDEMVLDLYRRLPEVRITDILLEVDAATGFTGAFTHLRTGAPCKDRIGLLNVLLAGGLNLGLSKMAEASNTHDFHQLTHLSRWHIESEAIDRALAMVIEAQAQLSMARFWGLGLTASSDGQFFPAARQGEAMNLVNARYGSEPGLKAYTHVSDRFGPFATQTIPATVNEAPYILDGLLMTRAGRRVREQYADSGGFTDHVFAVTSLPGYRFIPRIRDLPSKRLHVFEPRRVPKPLIGLTGNKVREDVIVGNWPDILRVAATLASGVLPPSQLLRKFAAYPRQHELAVALREIGRVERTLFIVDWLLDADMQRRANTGLNRPAQGRGSSRAQERPPDRTPGRNPRPLQRGPALPHGRAQPARRHHHLLEYRPSRRSGQTAATRRPDGRSRSPGPHLTPWVGPHPPHRRIPVAKAPIATLAYDSAPYRNRPDSRQVTNSIDPW